MLENHGKGAVVSTRQGQVRGTFADGVHAFKGVPFAAPPFGANHLRAPQPVKPWTGVRDAIEFGSKPPQPPFPGTDPNAPPAWDSARAGEDCLNLNIWTPDPGAARLPVLVWITGGSFMAGSAAWYDGSRFARDGVVCVAINYRAGAEGFVFLDGGVPNRGLLDQIAALRWVRDNIAVFGGDPDNVTVCGQSAGAMCIGTLLAAPPAEGLFRRAIMQSGAAHMVQSAASARRLARYLAQKLDVAPTEEAMAKLPVERILGAHMALISDLMARPDPERWGMETVASNVLFMPVIDGDVLPAAPIERIRAGASAGVDVLVGSAVDDWRLFLVFSGAPPPITDAMLAGPAAQYGYQSIAAYGLPADKALAAYRAARPSATPADLLAAIQTDWWCRIPAIRLADAHVANTAGTYMYEFAWPSPVGDGRFGACHALDIPFVFDTLDKRSAQMVGDLLGDDPPQSLASTMHSAWVNFIKCGDPGWPEYDLKRRRTMRFDIISEVIDDPRPMERALWEGTR